MKGIKNQTTSFDYEIILVDSGSVDNTRNIAKKYDVKIICIPPDDFSFGYSLNKGIEVSDGDYCVLISAHCFPVDEHWLENMIKPFKNDRIAIVYGKQRGSEINKYSENRIFKILFPDGSTDMQDLPFCNNANTAIRKELWHHYKYNEDITGLEDIDWAKFIISKEYKLYYNSDASVIHVHDETYLQIFWRYEREAIAMKTIFPEESFSFYEFLKCSYMNISSDLFNALKERVFIRKFFSIIAWRFIQFWGTYRGYKHKNSISTNLKKKLYYPQKRTLRKTKEKEQLMAIKNLSRNNKKIF